MTLPAVTSHENDPTVFVIDDDIALCQSLSWLLASVNLNVEIYHTGQEYLNSYDGNRHGCLLIDIRMPGMSGLELQEQLISRDNKLPIIMMTGHGDIPMAVRAMKAHAIDFITKPFNDQLLLEQIQHAIAQDKERLNNCNHSPKSTQLLSSLTSRERQILEYVVEGKLNKQIAYDLGISMKTVELHRARVMQKMQVRSVAELVKAYLIEKGEIKTES